ncbi:MAG: PaaI family thioesterase [Nitrospiraceae bacterium]|nr:PaaI family thioesterase [Nitrospiraceae bacterium]
MKRLSLSDDGHCFACGSRNPGGLRLVFRSEGGRQVAEFVPLKSHQGFKDIVHGGIITTVLDEAMMKAALCRGIAAVTAEITVRFRQPLHVGDRSVIEAEIIKTGKRLIEATARITAGSGVIAEAAAKLIRNG